MAVSLASVLRWDPSGNSIAVAVLGLGAKGAVPGDSRLVVLVDQESALSTAMMAEPRARMHQTASPICSNTFVM